MEVGFTSATVGNGTPKSERSAGASAAKNMPAAS